METQEDFRRIIGRYVQSTAFASLNSSDQQQNISDVTKAFSEQNPDLDINDINSTAQEININFLRGTGQGRVVPDAFLQENNIIYPNQEPGYADLSKEEKNTKIEEFRLKIPEIAKGNPTQQEDTEFFLNQQAKQLERRANGEGRGRVASYTAAAAEGFIAGLAEQVGATETAESLRGYFNENPEYDSELGQQIAAGAGSALTSITLFAATQASVGRIPGATAAMAANAATGVSLVSNGLMRYNEAYKNAITSGLDEEKASEAGWSATPAAVIDALSDKLLVSRVMPGEINKVLLSGSQIEKKSMLQYLTSNAGTRGKIKTYTKSAITEGLSEAVGDTVAAYGPYQTTGDNQFMPTDGEFGTSFLIGALLGAAIPGAIDSPKFFGNKTGKTETITTPEGGEIKVTPKYGNKEEKAYGESARNIEKLQPETQQQVYDLLAQGKYKDALRVSNSLITSQQTKFEEKQKAKQAADQQAADQQAADQQAADQDPQSNNNSKQTVDSSPEQDNNIIFDSEVNGKNYADLNSHNDLVEKSMSGVALDEVTTQSLEAFNTQLDLQSPLRKQVRDSIDLASNKDESEIKESNEAKRILDTTASKWIAANPSKSLEDFYSKLSLSLPEVSQQQNNTPEVSPVTKVEPKEIKAVSFDPGTQEVTYEDGTKSNLDPLLQNRKAVKLDPGTQEVTYEDGEVSKLPSKINEAVVNNTQAEEPSKTLSVKQKVELALKESGIQDEINAFETVKKNKIIPPDVKIQPQKLNVDLTETAKSANASADKALKDLESKFSLEPTVIKNNIEQNVQKKEFSTPEEYLTLLKSQNHPSTHQYIDRMIGDVKSKNPDLKFVLVSDDLMSKAYAGARGAFAQDSNTIFLNDESLQTVAHEVAHALTFSDIQQHVASRPESTYKEKLTAATLDENTPEGIKRLIEVFNNASKTTKNTKQLGFTLDPNSAESLKALAAMSPEQYAFTNLDEFVAAAMSDQDFQETLSSIPYKGYNVWQAIIDSITKSFDWISSIASSERLLRSDKQNALFKTLAATKMIIDAGNNNIISEGSAQLPKFQSIDQSYLNSYKSNDLKSLKSLVNEAAGLTGYDSSVTYYRGDMHEWTEGDRAYYLTTDELLAKQFAEDNGENGLVRKFYIKKDLKLASSGTSINNSTIQNSSFLGEAGQILGDGTFDPSINTYALNKAGYDGISGTADGSQINEIVITDPKNIKLAEAMTFDNEHKLIMPSERFNNQKNNIAYSPVQTRNKQLHTMYSRMAAIANGKLSDRFDGNTHQLVEILGTIKSSDVSKLEPIYQDHLMFLVNNMYESRKNAVQSPQLRMDSYEMIERLSMVKQAIDAKLIAKIIERYDGKIDFDYEGIDLNDLIAVKEVVNKYAKAEALKDTTTKNSRDKKAKARRDQITKDFIETGMQGQANAIERFGDAENYLSEMESMRGHEFPTQQEKDFVKSHFYYITTVRLEGKSGIDLYNHFYGINNLNDGTFGGMELTIAHIAKTRNANQDINSIAGKLNNPIADSNRFMNFIDTMTSKGELHQSRLRRISSVGSVKKWFQEYILGPMYEGTMFTANNMQKEHFDKYVKFCQEKLGREEKNTEDNIILSQASMLSQFKSGENMDAAILRMIELIKKSNNNVRTGGSPENKKLYKARVEPIFNKMIEGLEDFGPGVFEHFINSLPARMSGTEGIEIGKARADILEYAIKDYSKFDSSNELISEGFFHQPFQRQINYSPFHVLKNGDVHQNEKELNDQLAEYEGDDYVEGMRKKAAYLNERKYTLGDSDFYSMNFDYTYRRSIQKMCVDSAIIAERFILHERIKPGSELYKIMTQDGDSFRPERAAHIKSLGVSLINNAVTQGERLNWGIKTGRAVTGLYSSVTLSSFHNIISQPFATLVDYSVRNGLSAAKSWIDGASYYAGNRSKVNDWYASNYRWTGDRKGSEVIGLTQSRSISNDLDSKVRNMPIVKFLEKFHEKAGDIISFFMNKGDDFAAKATELAEYSRLMKEKGHIFNDIDELLSFPVDGKILSQATLNAELVSNTSNKILRGEAFSDRNNTVTALRNVFFAFASQQASLASQLNQAVRDIHLLRANGSSKGEIESKVRVIAAIMVQQAAFIGSRSMVGYAVTKGMIALIGLIKNNKDEEIEKRQAKLRQAKANRNKNNIILAEGELNDAVSLRKALIKIEQNSLSSDSLMKGMIRDSVGSCHLFLNSSIATKAIFLVPDIVFANSVKEQNEAHIKDQKKKIEAAKKMRNTKLAEKLERDLIPLESAEYIPFAYESNTGFGMTGIYGAAADQMKSTVEEAAKASLGNKEYNWNDVALGAISFGLGQAELTKFMKRLDSIEDAEFQAKKSFLPD